MKKNIEVFVFLMLSLYPFFISYVTFVEDKVRLIGLFAGIVITCFLIGFSFFQILKMKVRKLFFSFLICLNLYSFLFILSSF